MKQKVESVSFEGVVSDAEALANRFRNLAAAVEESRRKETRVIRLRKLLTWWRRKNG